MPKFIISGGPGAGKTTLLNALKVAGFAGSDEVSRPLIQEQVAQNSSCLPWTDLACFAQLALHRMITDYERAAQNPGITFFDRAIPDIIAYVRAGGLPVDASLYRAVRQYPYQQQVFMAPPWKEIYVNDSERWQTFAEAVTLHQALVATYQSLDFTIVDLPTASVADRVAFVRAEVAKYTGTGDGTGCQTDGLTDKFVSENNQLP